MSEDFLRPRALWTCLSEIFKLLSVACGCLCYLRRRTNLPRKKIIIKKLRVLQTWTLMTSNTYGIKKMANIAFPLGLLRFSAFPQRVAHRDKAVGTHSFVLLQIAIGQMRCVQQCVYSYRVQVLKVHIVCVCVVRNTQGTLERYCRKMGYLLELNMNVSSSQLVLNSVRCNVYRVRFWTIPLNWMISSHIYFHCFLVYSFVHWFICSFICLFVESTINTQYFPGYQSLASDNANKRRPLLTRMGYTLLKRTEDTWVGERWCESSINRKVIFSHNTGEGMNWRLLLRTQNEMGQQQSGSNEIVLQKVQAPRKKVAMSRYIAIIIVPYLP